MAFESVRDLVTAGRPDASVPGLVTAGPVAPDHAVAGPGQAAHGPALGSRAVQADATPTNLCALLSGVLVVGLGANAVAGWWWWADPLAGIAIAVVAAREAALTWRAGSLEDTCCARGRRPPSAAPRPVAGAHGPGGRGRLLPGDDPAAGHGGRPGAGR